MTQVPFKRKWRWLRHVVWVLGVKVFLIVALLVLFFGSGAANPLLRRLIVRRIDGATGGRTELRTLSVGWLSKEITLKGLVIHGKEPGGSAPLFSAEEVRAGLRIESFWGRKISLDGLILRQPAIHLRVDKDGKSNVPVPARPLGGSKPLRQTLFDLHVRHLQIDDGWLLYNEVKTPLAVEGGELALTIDASGALDHPLYLGNLEWQAIHFTALRYVPLPVDLSAKFTLWRDGITLEQGQLHAGRSHLDAQGDMNGFADPHWTFRYRGWVDLFDLREMLREPLVPTGVVDVRGEGVLAHGEYLGSGNYFGQSISLPYTQFHTSGLNSRGSYRIDNSGLVVPDFYSGVFGGSVTGRVTMRFSDSRFRAETHVENVRLAPALFAFEETSFPVDELHWDGIISADTVENWVGPFQHFDITGNAHFDAPDQVILGHQPINADWEFKWVADPNILTFESGEFATPSATASISGTLEPRHSNLSMKLDVDALEPNRDFINKIQGAKPGSADALRTLSGAMHWNGKITGPLGGPTFQGRLRGEHLQYDTIALDTLEGDLTYSPAQLTLTNARARRGQMDAMLVAELELTEWSFRTENNWTVDASIEKTPLHEIQQSLKLDYPVQGLLSGQFHGRGTRSQPAVTGLFDLSEATAYGLAFNRLRGQLNIQPDEIRVTNAELRFFAPGTEAGRGAGIVTGSAAYQFHDKSLSADLVGAGLPLENFQQLQSARFPLGGQVSFRMKLAGPAKAPSGQGTIRLVDLRVGADVIGSFEGNLESDGQAATFQVNSAMSTGELSGTFTLGLREPFPLNGKASIKNIDLDPFLLSAFHVKQFSGHGEVAGDIAVSGSLKQPQSLTVDARFSRLVLNYENVRLENAGDVHFRSSRESFEIEPATFRGSDTNLQIAGSVGFTGRRNVNLKLNGAMDLRLLDGFAPGLDTQGAAQIDAAFEGTLDRPRITGKVHVDKASARAADFPTGLSAIKGDLIFDASRAFFQSVTAEVGGGELTLTGSVSYADRPIRYDVGVRTDRVRIRYPEGMSWLVGGNLRLTGTLDAGLLSGRVVVQRVNFNQGVESAASLFSGQGGISGPSGGSTFLRNLQFDITGQSAPDARMEWPGAELEADADVRVRGTWEHPILLGHVHILSGDLFFAGNRYRVSRGDINFADPFRLDPVLNVEATTTIRQYEITLDFTGPSSKLALSYRSDPPLPGNDIITLLALGQTSSEASSHSGGPTQTNSGATALLSEAISSQLGGRLERLFGITRFRVDPGLTTLGSTTATDQNPAARVTVEQQISRNLTITYVSNVGSTQQQVIQVEYNISRSLSLVALRDYNGTFGIDLVKKKRFD
ncbi:MAG TPA: translocation/assembly module TamB domain-containing protein [Candidatus Acidoferrum sp.]|nr:translocation/assembly module TamB domain-containing protein [Candidatus Acidoferrum sp.]